MFGLGAHNGIKSVPGYPEQPGPVEVVPAQELDGFYNPLQPNPFQDSMKHPGKRLGTP